MSKKLTLYAIACLLFFGCKAQKQSDNTHSDHQYTNHLVNQSSPYLLQHAHNPVDWFPWGEEALTKAKEENKMMIISVGYAACHWCHVMEHESFEDTLVARKMNENFVCIKVDREERPDVDQIYMNAAYMINGSGGWPLNAIALPDGRPIFAGTYFPKDNWIKILDYFVKNYEEERDELETQAEKITEGIQQIEMVPFQPEPATFVEDDLKGIFASWKTVLDFKKGGKTTKSNKFPMPSNWAYLLRYHSLFGDEEALKAVNVTLKEMANGGIYDHLGGGFARYSTDPDWHVPHFEKMLYDNGQLVSLYSEAYQYEANPLYKQRVYETLEFVKRELTSPEGGFYSSLDADSEGEEGKFYVWTKAEIDSILEEEEATFFNVYYNVTARGNWEEHKNVLRVLKDKKEVATKLGVPVAELEQVLQGAKTKLMAARDKRVRPPLDDKVLTGWNALMLKGYVDAYRVFGEQEFLDIALKNANFLVKNALQSDNRLNRNYKDGKSSINAFLDDYSLLIEAFVSLYQATFDEQWLYKSKDLAEYAIAHFHDDDSKMFFYTSDEDAALIARKMEITDNVIPSSNSSMAKALFYLGTYFNKEDYLKMSEQMLTNVKEDVKTQAPFYSNWVILMTHFVKTPYEVAIVGPDFAAKRAEMDNHFLPNSFLLGGNSEGTLELLKSKFVEGKNRIYVCQNKVCKFPVEEVSKAVELME